MWAKANNPKKLKKQDLAQWVNLGLKKAFTSKNIKSGFRGIGIQPFNKEAWLTKWDQVEYFSSLKDQERLTKSTTCLTKDLKL